jgi:uncharacterized membrane protein
MMKNPSKETTDKWRKNYNNWKFESFYYNKEDNRLFPPKRIPWMGWTINFANWKSIVTFGLLFGTILLILWIKKPQ